MARLASFMQMHLIRCMCMERQGVVDHGRAMIPPVIGIGTPVVAG